MQLEDDGAYCLVPGGSGDVLLDGEPTEELRDLSGAHLGRMALVVEQDVAADPRDVGLLGAAAAVACAERIADPVEQARRARLGWLDLADDEYGR
jgi:hypothetical protein